MLLFRKTAVDSRFRGHDRTGARFAESLFANGIDRKDERVRARPGPGRCIRVE